MRSCGDAWTHLPGFLFLGPWRCRRSRSGGDLGLYARDRTPITWILFHKAYMHRVRKGCDSLDIQFCTKRCTSFASVMEMVTGKSVSLYEQKWNTFRNVQKMIDFLKRGNVLALTCVQYHELHHLYCCSISVCSKSHFLIQDTMFYCPQCNPVSDRGR